MVTTSQNPSGLGLFRDLLTAVHLSLNPQRCQFPVHFIPRRRRRREHRRNGEPSSLSLSETMPDLRESIVGGGYWIRRVDYSPTTVAAQGKARRFFPTNNKENIPCGWRKSPAARFRRPGRSPLPDWYPRTPLRDITSIVKAYEKRRLRIQAAQTAATSSSAAPDLQITNPQPQESSSTASQRSMKLPIKACQAITTEPPLQTDESPQTPAPLTDHADDGQTAVTESTLLNSIEQIEKAVKKNMIKMKKPENKRATQLRNLMSMR